MQESSVLFVNELFTHNHQEHLQYTTACAGNKLSDKQPGSQIKKLFTVYNKVASFWRLCKANKKARELYIPHHLTFTIPGTSSFC